MTSGAYEDTAAIGESCLTDAAVEQALLLGVEMSDRLLYKHPARFLVPANEPLQFER